MSFQIGTNFNLNTRLFLDSRQSATNLNSLIANAQEFLYPPGFEVYCVAEAKYYRNIAEYGERPIWVDRDTLLDVAFINDEEHSVDSTYSSSKIEEIVKDFRKISIDDENSTQSSTYSSNKIESVFSQLRAEDTRLEDEILDMDTRMTWIENRTWMITGFDGSYNSLTDLPTLHEHENKEILDGITQEKIESWDNVSNIDFDIYAKQTDVEELQSEITRLEQRNESQDVAIKTAESNILELNSELQNVKNDNKSQDTTMETIQSSILEINDILQDINEKDELQDEEMRILKEKEELQNIDIQTLASENSSQNARISTLEQNLNASNDRIKATEEKNVEQDNRLNAIEEENTKQNTKISNIEAINVEQDDRINMLEIDSSSYQVKITNIETKNTQQDERLDEIEDLNTAQNRRIEAIEAQNSAQNNRIDAIEVRNTVQDYNIQSLYASNQRVTLETDINGQLLHNSAEDNTAMVKEIQGNTMVNLNKEADKELVLNGNIDTQGQSVDVVEGVDGGLVDIYLEGNTMVNVIDQEEAVPLTKSYIVETGNHVAFEGEYDGKAKPYIHGNTLVNVIDQEESIPLTKSYTVENSGNHVAFEGEFDGKAKPYLYGNTMVNLCDQEESIPLTKSYTVENNGNHIAFQGEYDGKAKPYLYGNTMVNLIDHSKRNPDSVSSRYEDNTYIITDYYSANLLPSSAILLKPNTTYTTYVEVSTDAEQFLSAHGSIALVTSEGVLFHLYAPSNLSNKTIHVFTTPSDFVLENYLGVYFYGYTGCVTTFKNFMVLEGDYTDKPMPSYFECMKSSFEDKKIFNLMTDYKEESNIEYYYPITSPNVANVSMLKPNTEYTIIYKAKYKQEGDTGRLVICTTEDESKDIMSSSDLVATRLRSKSIASCLRRSSRKLQ